MPGSTILDMPPPEQEWMLGELRRARCGYLLSLPVLLFCSRSSVYRMVNSYTAHARDDLFDALTAVSARSSWLTPSLRRSLLAFLKKAP